MTLPSDDAGVPGPLPEAYAGLKPAEVWEHFWALNRIPRPSGEEAAARNYARRVAVAAGARCSQDSAGNLVARVPAIHGREHAPTVILQAHLDMVCEQRPGVGHDFLRDPIRPRREGDRIYASGTTLGADNGIGVACALAAITAPGVLHGPLEVLLTVEEETGLGGAARLDASMLSGRLLVNLDSEAPGVLTVGCAGGAGAVLRLNGTLEPAPPSWHAWRVRIGGLRGGHSGVHIHEPLANAIQLLVEVLRRLQGLGFEMRLAALPGERPETMEGGNAHNAVPRDAVALIAAPGSAGDALAAAHARIAAELQGAWARDEPGLRVVLESVDPAEVRVVAREDIERLTQLLAAVPHGVLSWSTEFPDTVETSSNLATMTTHAKGGALSFEIGTSSRSFIPARLEEVQREIAQLAEIAGATVVPRDGYPGWVPNTRSELLRTAMEVHQMEFGRAPAVRVVHAGLECGVLADRIPGLEAISFGPALGGAHTPEEWVGIPSVAQTWQLLTGLLRRVSEER